MNPVYAWHRSAPRAKQFHTSFSSKIPPHATMIGSEPKEVLISAIILRVFSVRILPDIPPFPTANLLLTTGKLLAITNPSAPANKLVWAKDKYSSLFFSSQGGNFINILLLEILFNFSISFDSWGGL